MDPWDAELKRTVANFDKHHTVQDMHFSATGSNGCVVELVVLDADRMLDVTLAEGVDLFTKKDFAAPLPTKENSSGESEALDSFSGIVVIGPNLVTLADEETNPVWWVRNKDQPGMLVTLSYALSLLEESDREAAIGAHLNVLRDLVDHERAARGISENDGDGEARCVACVAEPDMHVEMLVDAIVTRTRDLVDAISLYQVKLVCGKTPKIK